MIYHKQWFLILLISFHFVGCLKGKETDEQKREQTLLIFENFQKSLQAELSSSIQKSGTTGAIDKCKIVSPEMEHNYSKENVIIKRISDKPRNPEHKAEDWESSVIKKWKDEIAEGKKPSIAEKVTNGEYKVLKPILIGNALCLQCHGDKEKIDPATLKMIQEKYPNDMAVDYKLNEVRGAFLGIWKK